MRKNGWAPSRLRKPYVFGQFWMRTTAKRNSRQVFDYFPWDKAGLHHQHSPLQKIEDLLRIPGKDEFRLNDIWVSSYYLCFVERPTRLSKVFTKEKV